jgi:hypothetical protein
MDHGKTKILKTKNEDISTRKNGIKTNYCPFINEDFCSRSRHAKKITTGI